METPTTTPRPVLSLKQRNGHIVRSDLEALGPMLAYYRVRRGLTRSELGIQALTMSSSTIAQIEQGGRGIGTRNQALRLVAALGLESLEADHFLHVAGFATVIDWQQFTRDILVDLGLGSVYEDEAAKLYARLAQTHARRARVPRRRVTDE